MEKKLQLRPNFSIFDLLKKYKLNNKKIAIEHNGAIVQRSFYKKIFQK